MAIPEQAAVCTPLYAAPQMAGTAAGGTALSPLAKEFIPSHGPSEPWPRLPVASSLVVFESKRDKRDKRGQRDQGRLRYLRV